MESKNPVNSAFWKRTIGLGEQKEGDFEIAQNILKSDGSLEKTRLEALKWATEAKSKLKSLPKCKINGMLFDLASFVVSRVC